MQTSLLITAGITGFFAILIWRLWDNIRKNNKQIKVNHTIETWIRAGLLLPVYTVLGCVNPIGTFISALFLLLAWWLLLFDGFFAILRNREGFFDLGSNDGKDDSLTDRLFRKVGLTWHIIIKIGLVVITTLIYCLTV